MGTEVEKFDPESIVNAIRVDIRERVMKLIPQDRIDIIIRQEMDYFLSDGTRAGQHRHKVEVDSLRGIVRKELREWSKEKITEIINEGGWIERVTWIEGQKIATPGDVIKQTMIDNAPKIISEVFGMMMATVVNNLQQSSRGY